MRQKPPLAARLDDVPEGIKQFAKRALSLRRVFAHQGEIRQQKLPFSIRDVAGIRLPCRVHRRKAPARQVLSQ